MKHLLAGAIAAGLLATGVPAQAHPNYHYLGGCRAFAVDDPTREAGWQNWAISLVVVATTANGVPAPTAVVAASCELKVNGVSQGTFVSGTGTGVVAAAGQLQFTAAASDVFTVCEHVSVNGEAHTACSAPNPLPFGT